MMEEPNPANPAGKSCALHLKEVTSTQEVALKWVREGDRRYQLVFADHQTAGRGRHGAFWYDQAGTALLASYVLWEIPLPEPIGALSMIAALAAGRSLEEVSGGQSRILLKYPNDLIWNERKLGGILVEVAETPQRQRVAVVGVGINLARTELPPTIRAVSLQEVLGGSLPAPPLTIRDQLVFQLLEELPAVYDEFQKDPNRLLQGWRLRDGTTGRRYQVLDLPGQPVASALHIEPDFQLCLRLSDGTLQRTYWVTSV